MLIITFMNLSKNLFRIEENFSKLAHFSINKIMIKNCSSKGIDLDKAAAIENDETMIINSDHSITTTPVENPQSDIAGTSGSKISPERRASQFQVESDETPTSDTSSSEAAAGKNKRHRPKARSESNRSEKYAKTKFFFSIFVFRFPRSIRCSFQTCPFSDL